MRWVASTALLALLLATGGDAAETPEAPAPLSLESCGDAEKVAADLGGVLVSALAARPEELWLLIRPPGDPDGERRLTRLTLEPSARLGPVASEIPGWTKTLIAVELAEGPRLLVGGLGRVDDWGPFEAPTAAPRPLVEHPGLDLRSLGPSPLRLGIERRLAAAEAGWLRVWRPDGAGGLALAESWRLPLTVEREETGLELRSPPVTAISRTGDASEGGRFVAGPEARGGRRLSVALLGPGESVEEAWLALPGIERVEASWRVELGGEPALVVRTQGGVDVDLFEPQRYRVFPLAADRTRAGRAPRLAVELDSKRWHATQVVAADADGDGHDDLLLARPEGMTGGDLVVEVFVGRGGVRFEKRSRRTDLDRAPADHLLVADLDGAGRPGLVALYDTRVELLEFAAGRGGRALARAPRLACELGPQPAPESPTIEVRVEREGASGERLGGAGRTILGVLPDATAPRLLLLETEASGAERLIVVRAPSRD